MTSKTNTICWLFFVLVCVSFRSSAQEPREEKKPSIDVSVLGMVAKPSRIVLPAGSTVLDAIASVGGLTSTADPATSKLVHKHDGGEPKIVVVDIDQVLNNPVKDIPLQDGDMLYVPESAKAQYLSATILASIAVAALAGLFSLLNLVITKEQKISEIRRERVDSMIDDLAQYLASIDYMTGANRVWIGQGRPNVLDHYKAVQPSIDLGSRAYTSIVLRINATDENRSMKQERTQFLSEISALKQNMNDEKFDDVAAAIAPLREKLKPILNNEWEKIRKGELAYRITRAVAIIIVLAGLAAAFVFAYRAYHTGGAVPNNQTVKVAR